MPRMPVAIISYCSGRHSRAMVASWLAKARHTSALATPFARELCIKADRMAVTRANWRGEAHIAAGWAAFHGSGGDNRPHRHHAVQLVVSGAAPVRLWLEGATQAAIHGAAIAADHLHCVHPDPVPILLIYLDAESACGRTLQRWLGGQSRLLDASQAEAARDWWGQRAAWQADADRRLLAQLGISLPAEPASLGSEKRVEAVLRALPTLSALPRHTAEVAALAALSPSRFAHLFRQRTGMAVRPYLRWLRLKRTVAALAAGVPATEAASAAGFADAAHMSRTFRRHLGVTPGAVSALDGRSAGSFNTSHTGE